MLPTPDDVANGTDELDITVPVTPYPAKRRPVCRSEIDKCKICDQNIVEDISAGCSYKPGKKGGN